MATSAADGSDIDESDGAGGKFLKMFLRISFPATPYDRPPTAARDNNPGLLSMVVDTTSRLIYAASHKIFGVFRKRLPPLSDINEEPQSVSQEAWTDNSTGVSDEGGSSASNSAVTGILELEQILKEETFTRSETQSSTALLHSRTCDNAVERDVAKPPAPPTLRLEASTSGSLDNFHAVVVSSTGSEEQIASPTEAYQGSTIGTSQESTLINSNNATCLSKKVVTSPRYPATLENFPDDLLINIFVRLLAKQVAQMRCVCKSWNAILSHPFFVKSHLHHSIHNNDRILLVFYNASSSDDQPFTAIPCSSPHLELTNFIELPPVDPNPTSGDTSSIIGVIGSVHGLICSSYDESIIQIWNPSLSVFLTLPPHHIPSRGSYEIFFRFGFDPKTDDYKLVKVTGLTIALHANNLAYPVKEWLQVEIYSMRKGYWEFITQRFPSHVTRIYEYRDVCVDGRDGHLHWLGDIDEEANQQTIVAFDLGSETFREISLPNAILGYNGSNPIGVVGGKLCFMSWVYGDNIVCEVWVMDEYGVAESWVKHHIYTESIGDEVSFGFTSRSEFLFEDNESLFLFGPTEDKAKILL